MWDTIPTSFVLFPFCFVEYIYTTRIVYNNFPVWKMRNLLVLDSLHSLILLLFPSLPEFHPESQEKDIADKYILLLWSDLWDSVQHTKGNTCCFCRCRRVRVEGSVGSLCFESTSQHSQKRHSQKNSRLLSVPLGDRGDWGPGNPGSPGSTEWEWGHLRWRDIYREVHAWGAASREHSESGAAPAGEYLTA